MDLRDGSLHNVWVAPDDQALVLTNVHIVRQLCSAQDPLWSCDSRRSHGRSRGHHLSHRAPGDPSPASDPILAVNTATFTSFCCMIPSCAAKSWCWSSTWPRNAAIRSFSCCSSCTTITSRPAPHCTRAGPERRVPSPNTYIADAKFCFCKNNKRIIINRPWQSVPAPCSCDISTGRWTSR